MLSVSPNCIIRSSLEDMLVALQRRDENKWQQDVPPALPRRVVSRSRLPLAKRLLPVSSEADATRESSVFCVGKGEMRGQSYKIGPLEDFKEQLQQGPPEEEQKGLHGHHENQHPPELERVVVTFQSYVRGEIARREYSALLRLKKPDICENKLDHQEVQPLVVEELQKRALKAEATLELKEQENESLREQVQQYKAMCSELEAKTKSDEVTWQKQIASLQNDLAAARKSAAAECTIPKQAQPEKNNCFNAGSNGGKELTGSKVIVEDETRAVVKVENSQFASPVEKLRGFKRTLKAWTKDYKFGVRDSNKKIHSVGLSEAADKPWKTWWGKKSKRSY